MSEVRSTENESLRPSYFANLGQPCCSRWGKSEIEWIALAYVRALANDGNTWRPMTREQVRKALTSEQLREAYEPFLTDDFYKHWFDSVAAQITDADGAFGVGGFWNRRRHVYRSCD